MSILHLTLKKKWFDMILSGEKKEEYREIKPYWCKRLFDYKCKDEFDELNEEYDICDSLKTGQMTISKSAKIYDTIRFTNGYSPTSPTLDITCHRISIGVGKQEWGAPADNVFILSLGTIISTKNISK